MSNSILEGDNHSVKYFRTSIDIDMKYCLICYTIESPDKLKCCYYNSIENKIYDVFYNSTSCGTKIYAFNTFYFKDSNEYVVSCLDNQKLKFSMERISSEFSLIDNEDNTFEEKTFSGCYTLTYFSIIYISAFGQYF